MQTSVVLATSP